MYINFFEVADSEFEEELFIEYTFFSPQFVHIRSSVADSEFKVENNVINRLNNETIFFYQKNVLNFNKKKGNV